MKPLYEITNEYLYFLNKICESEEITEEDFSNLDNYKDDIKQKIINISSFIKNTEHECESIDRAIFDLAERCKMKRERIERIKEYLMNNMDILKITEVTCPYFDVKIKKNPCSVDITNMDKLPKEYIKEVILTKVDRKSIALKIKSGEEVPGAILQRTNRVEIK